MGPCAGRSSAKSFPSDPRLPHRRARRPCGVCGTVRYVRISQASPITRAAIGTAQSARPWLARSGLPNGQPSCCRSRTSTLYLRCLEQIGNLALQNAREIYRILFRAASETLLTIAADPKRLGAEIGFLAVLHTWGQNLHLHPHLHCVVPGGGIRPDGLRWIGCKKPSFFLPVKVLSSRFQRLLLTYLSESFRKGRLNFHGDMARLAQPATFEALCQQARRIPWVVFVKPPFGGPEQVLKYLARYTHRVAISNRRLLSMEDGRVNFEYKDYAESQSDEGHDASSSGVHSAFSAAYPAQRFCAHPAVRLSRQSCPRKETGIMQDAA